MSLYVDAEGLFGSFHLDAHLELESGVLGLLGASGSGKSMTLKCIAGIEKPQKGRIELDGTVLFDSQRHIHLKPQQRHVGYLFQHYALFPHMTVRQNILCGLQGEKNREKRENALREALALFRLTGLENRKPAGLSGGEQQRVALARILVNRPRLLMLDEPFSALDTHLRLRLQLEMLQVFRNWGCPVLMVTHSRDEAYRMCDQIAVMAEGRIEAPRPTKELFAMPGTVHAAVLTGCKNIAPARKAGPRLLYVPEWGITLETARDVPEETTHVGIRAHYFNPREARNRFPVAFSAGMEEPFEWVFEFRFASQAPVSRTVWWRMPKEKRPVEMPAELGVSPVNVIPLRGEAAP